MTPPRSPLARLLPVMRADEPVRMLSPAERRALAQLWDGIGYILLPKQDLRNVELDAALVLQRRYLERRV